METKIEKPVVKHTIRDVSIVRSGRGYSISELKQCGLDNIKFARNRGIIIDKLRKTAYPENIQRLKILVATIIESERKKKNDIRKGKIATRKRQKIESTGDTSTKKQGKQLK
jgi:ribosomal protein L13E